MGSVKCGVGIKNSKSLIRLLMKENAGLDICCFNIFGNYSSHETMATTVVMKSPVVTGNM